MIEERWEEETGEDDGGFPFISDSNTAGRETDGKGAKQTGRRTDRQTSAKTDRQTDRGEDRQTAWSREQPKSLLKPGEFP